MRTRTRSTVLSSRPSKSSYAYVNTQYNCDGTTSVTNGNTGTINAINTSIHSSRIDDALNRATSNPCRHYQTWEEILPYGGTTYPAYAGGFGHIHYGAWSNDLAYSSAKYWADLVPSWDINASSVAAPPGWSLNTAIPNDASVVNDLFEKSKGLKADVLLNIVEANQAWPSLRSLTNCLPEMARNWRNIRKVIKTASGSYLAWKFGVSPILSDLANIAKFSPDMQRQFLEFKKQSNKVYSKVFPSNPTFARSPVSFSANGVVASIGTYQGYGLGPCNVRYVLVVKPNAPRYLTDAFAKADFLMRRFSTSPASLAWEKVPFSFVVDWFVDLRGALDSIDKAIGFNPYKVISLTKSVSYDLQTDCFLDSYKTCASHGSLFSGKVATKRYKYYERSVLTSSAMPMFKPRFGKSQAGISAALIAQKLSNV